MLLQSVMCVNVILKAFNTWQLNSDSAGFVTELGEHLGTGSNTKTTNVTIYINH